MNLYAALAAVVLWGASLLGTAVWFFEAGADSEIATQARVETVAKTATDAASKAAAEAIASIEIKQVTIRQKLQREVQTREIYRDCVADPSARRLLNTSPGIAQPPASAASGSKLPAAGAP